MSTLRHRIEERLEERFAELRRNAERPLPKNMFDPVFTNLDELIDIVASIRDFSTEPYLQKVRNVICPACAATVDGVCPRRDAKTCGLNEFFPQIVAIIEKECNADPGLED